MEKSTSLTFLYYKAAGEQEFTKLVDITSYPDIYTKPEKLDVSTLSSNQKKYTEGMVDTPDYDFGFIYSKEAYQKIKALAGDNTIFFQLWFGEAGEYGKWQWTGSVFVTPSAGDVGAARTGVLTCYLETDITEVDVNRVYIAPIDDQALVVGTNKTIVVNVTPSDAALTAASSDTDKATVAFGAGSNAKKLTITPLAAGTTVITVTGTKADHTTDTETFSVTVSGSAE